MKSHRLWEKYENCIITMLTIVVNLVLLSICFDFYYDLNDDVMMKANVNFDLTMELLLLTIKEN